MDFFHGKSVKNWRSNRRGINRCFSVNAWSVTVFCGLTLPPATVEQPVAIRLLAIGDGGEMTCHPPSVPRQ